MATKERVIQLIDSLPDTPETESRLDAIEHELEPNGLSEDDAMLVGHEAAIERLRAESAALDERFADVTEEQVRAAIADSQ
jgi:hypothetical protein